MPRDGSSVYRTPPGTEGVPDTVIESAKYNTFIADIEQDLNLPRPILAGGTGAISADAALVELGAEKASQIVTNYNSHVFVAGSFYSASSATGSPVSGHAFAGIVYVVDSNNLFIEARDLDGTPPQMYVRQKDAGVWGAWSTDFDQTSQNTLNDTRYVNTAGDTMTGNLTVLNDDPVVVVNKPVANGHLAGIQGSAAGSARWLLQLGNTTPESGSNSGSDFNLSRYNDAGLQIDAVLSAPRSTGLLSVRADPTAALGIATKQYVDATAIDSTELAAAAVRHDIAQSLTTTQKRQAQANLFQGPTAQYLTATGTYTTPAGVTWIEIELVGGGAGGAGSGTGAGSGNNGGFTTFGTGPILSSGQALSGVTTGGGAGGTPSGGFVNKIGGAGGNASGLANSKGGMGGISFFGGAGDGGAAGGGVGMSAVASSGSGGGGAGAAATISGGGGGGSGGYVRHIIHSPNSAYGFQIGNGGNGGNAGTSGAVGGAGAPGCIIVTEYYGS